MWLKNKEEEKGNDEQNRFVFLSKAPEKSALKMGSIFYTNTHLWKQCMEKYAYSSR